MRMQRLSWCAPFLAALRETGNATRACETAGVKYHTAYSLKLNNAGFAGEWQKALAESPGKKNDTWMQKFLAALRETGRITVSAERAGVRRESVTRARRRNPAFDGQCREALTLHDWKPAFLAHYRECGRADIAAQHAHIKPHTVRDRRRLDSAFDRQCREAKAAFDGEKLRETQAESGVWKRAFIATLRRACNVRAACNAAGVDLSAAYRERNADRAFAEEWSDAVGMACDSLQVTAFQRAKKYSDSLLMWLLQAHRPHIYREGYNPLHFTEKQLAAMNDEERAALQTLQNFMIGREDAPA